MAMFCCTVTWSGQNITCSSLQPTAEVDLSSVKSSSLISHPAKQTVFDFLCKLVIDNLRTAQIGNGFPILEAILEVQRVS